MAHLIDKDALVAEIERLYNLEYYNTSDLSCGKKIMLRNILLFLDALEAKEVDLEKEMGKYLDVNNIEYGFQVKLFGFAKHFFELGLKAQKGE